MSFPIILGFLLSFFPLKPSLTTMLFICHVSDLLASLNCKAFPLSPLFYYLSRQLVQFHLASPGCFLFQTPINLSLVFCLSPFKNYYINDNLKSGDPDFFWVIGQTQINPRILVTSVLTCTTTLPNHL